MKPKNNKLLEELGTSVQTYLRTDCQTGSPYISCSRIYIWSLCSLLCFVAPQLAALLATNKFVLDTNYSFTVSTVVGSANERQQSPHHRCLFVSSNSDRRGGGGRQTMHSSLAAGLKVAPFRGRSGRSKGWETKRCEVILNGFSVCLF